MSGIIENIKKIFGLGGEDSDSGKSDVQSQGRDQNGGESQNQELSEEEKKIQERLKNLGYM